MKVTVALVLRLDNSLRDTNHETRYGSHASAVSTTIVNVRYRPVRDGQCIVNVPGLTQSAKADKIAKQK